MVSQLLKLVTLVSPRFQETRNASRCSPPYWSFKERVVGGRTSDGPSNCVPHPAATRDTSSSDKRLIVVSLHVAGAKRTFRALFDSDASNNFVHADSLHRMSSRIQTRESPGGMVVRHAAENHAQFLVAPRQYLMSSTAMRAAKSYL